MATVDERLRKKEYHRLWQEYCGFLDLSMNEYMNIQRRLLEEQLALYNNCRLGEIIFKGHKPKTIEDFRQLIPYTTYDDYADYLLSKDKSVLPAEPVVWIQTTWEGGRHPIKVAPYTRGILDSHKDNVLGALILATSTKKGEFSLRCHDKFLNGMAPLPYLTGLLPYAIENDLTLDFLPPAREAEAMSFGQRNKEGFKCGLIQGIDLFFGLSSVISYMSEQFVSGGLSSGNTNSLKLISQAGHRTRFRLIKAGLRRALKKKPIYPKDIWTLKGLICSGTDTASFRDKIEHYWGIRPTELFGGTEPTCIGVETWRRNGLVLFPDVCFYEFIPETEMEKNLDDPTYVPKSYLINELVEGENYELVISNFKGGAFMRYRVGDMFRCLSLSNPEDGLDLPEFRFIDRVPPIIDISGFIRITERTVEDAIRLSRLDISDWFACKQFDRGKRAFMHLFVELDTSKSDVAFSKELITEQLGIYFRYVDSDYKDLRRMLGIDPLKITILPPGTIAAYNRTRTKPIRRINPGHYVVTDILRMHRPREEEELLCR